MKKNNFILGFCVLASLIIVLSIIFLVFSRSNISVPRKFEHKRDCVGFAGGGYLLLFNTNGGNDIGTMRTCIACSPSTYSALPVPVKEGSVFLGWYYDENLTEKVDVSNNGEIEPVVLYDKNKCMTGYKDIILYAKWDK